MAALVRLIVATIFASSLQVNVAHGSTEGTKSVLLLYSHQTNAPIIADWDRGIRRALAAGFPEGIRIETEHLDLGREEDDEYQDLPLIYFGKNTPIRGSTLSFQSTSIRFVLS